jgi:hypothetical protein
MGSSPARLTILLSTFPVILIFSLYGLRLEAEKCPLLYSRGSVGRIRTLSPRRRHRTPPRRELLFTRVGARLGCGRRLKSSLRAEAHATTAPKREMPARTLNGRENYFGGSGCGYAPTGVAGFAFRSICSAQAFWTGSGNVFSISAILACICATICGCSGATS